MIPARLDSELSAPPPLLADDLYPIALLTEEMNSEDTEVRINAMRQLRKVAAALGPERTRKELISFLQGASYVASGLFVR